MEDHMTVRSQPGPASPLAEAAAAGWQPIDTAPHNGSIVEAGKAGLLGIVWHPTKARFLDGRWCLDLGDRWASYDPQPTLWMPLPAH